MGTQGSLHYEEPTAEQVAALPGWTLLEFGYSGCGICARAQPEIQHALHAYSWIQHLKVQDGPGRRLGRSFGVKLWPTLVLLSEGLEVGRLVRPANRQVVADLLQLTQ
jgi:thioredoxin 1